MKKTIAAELLKVAKLLVGVDSKILKMFPKSSWAKVNVRDTWGDTYGDGPRWLVGDEFVVVGYQSPDRVELDIDGFHTAFHAKNLTPEGY